MPTPGKILAYAAAATAFGTPQAEALTVQASTQYEGDYLQQTLDYYKNTGRAVCNIATRQANANFGSFSAVLQVEALGDPNGDGAKGWDTDADFYSPFRSSVPGADPHLASVSVPAHFKTAKLESLTGLARLGCHGESGLSFRLQAKGSVAESESDSSIGKTEQSLTMTGRGVAECRVDFRSYTDPLGSMHAVMQVEKYDSEAGGVPEWSRDDEIRDTYAGSAPNSDPFSRSIDVYAELSADRLFREAVRYPVRLACRTDQDRTVITSQILPRMLKYQ